MKSTEVAVCVQVSGVGRGSIEALKITGETREKVSAVASKIERDVRALGVDCAATVDARRGVIGLRIPAGHWAVPGVKDRVAEVINSHVEDGFFVDDL